MPTCVFLDMKKNHGIEELRARTSSTACGSRSVHETRGSPGGPSSACPHVRICRSGDAFDAKYAEYEEAGVGSRRSTPKIFGGDPDAQVETERRTCCTRTRATRRESKNLGTIRSSNLRTEIVQFADEVPQLASLR